MKTVPLFLPILRSTQNLGQLSSKKLVHQFYHPLYDLEILNFSVVLKYKPSN